MLESLLGYYKKEKRLAVEAEHSSVVPLAKEKREEIYSCFRCIVEKYVINLSICGCMNPDIDGLCNITGAWPGNNAQPGLFD